MEPLLPQHQILVIHYRAAAYIVPTINIVSAKAERPNLRVDVERKALLEAASRAVGTSVSTFALTAATEASDVLADRRVFLLDEDAWQVFDETLNRPPEDAAGLSELMATPTVLDVPPSGASQ